jgi:hypothetical protein
MTLVLTELSSIGMGSFGIAMTADSAVTHTQTQTGLSYVVPNAARKLQIIPHLNAGISCWGIGTINDIPTDQWLSNFINSSTALTTLQSFANELARQLNEQVPSNASGTNRQGFHLAAFENYNGIPMPSFFHIHDGPSTVLEERGISVNPCQFNANHDMPPEIFQQNFSHGGFYTTRNGDYQLYANIFGLLKNFFRQLGPLGILIPSSQNLLDRAEYLVFQIRTMSEIYRLSNLVPGIGGGIYYLTINQNGIHSQGIRYF